MFSPAILLCAAALASGDDPEPTFELPPGPASEAVAALSADCDPVADLLPWPVPQSAHWSSRDSWSRWLVAVRRAAGGTGEFAARSRAELALLAASQGRAEMAWEHLAATAGHPNLVAAILPALLPGAPPGPPGVGGLPAALPDGVRLQPLVPPPDAEADPRLAAQRQMSVRGLRVGAATLALTVELAPDGVELEFEHLDGGPCHLLVHIPQIPGLETRLEYVDWIRQEDVGAARRVDLHPGGEPVSLWGRAVRSDPDHPITFPERLPAKVVEAGIAIELDPRDPAWSRLNLFARALTDLLEVPGSVRTTTELPPPAAIDPLVIRLPGGPQRERKLGQIMDLAERWVLERR